MVSTHGVQHSCGDLLRIKCLSVIVHETKNTHVHSIYLDGLKFSREIMDESIRLPCDYPKMSHGKTLQQSNRKQRWIFATKTEKQLHFLNIRKFLINFNHRYIETYR